jgi:glutaminyl-tRNA synthetase
MGVLQPLPVRLAGFSPSDELLVADFPFDPSRGQHGVYLEEVIFIDQSDFRLQDSEDYFGLAPNKTVGLKYACRIHCDRVEVDEWNRPIVVHCHLVAEHDRPEDKPKAAIQWVAKSTAVQLEARLYHPLFITEEPSDESWEAELNPDSEVVLTEALVDRSLLKHLEHLQHEGHVQFERVGFFVLDKDSVICDNSSEHKLVMNLTVNLKDSKPKDVAAAGAAADATATAGTGATRSRKEEQAKQLAEKMARMTLDPKDMFRKQVDLYSALDEDGIPTHDAAGEKISKSLAKKLRKDWEKQKKVFEAASAAAGGNA